MTAIIETIHPRVDLIPGMRVHLWLKARRAGRPGSVSIRVGGELQELVCADEAKEFVFREVNIDDSGWLDFVWSADDTVVSYLYAFNPATVLEQGIHLLHISESARGPHLPESFHFRPPLGWMNDPNGFCKVGRLFHLFYQHNPHDLKWSTMHWGHAVSNDLLHWRDQPILLVPGEQTAEGVPLGGAFSGSAVPTEEGAGLRVFFTDHVTDREPKEIQRCALVADGIRAEESRMLLGAVPCGLGLRDDFRDPYVFRGPDGRLHMLVGGGDAAGGAVLHYRTDNPDGVEGWTFASILHRDSRDSTAVMECPCLVPIRGAHDCEEVRWVLIYSQMDSVDPQTGRRNLCKAVVGGFDGSAFCPQFEQDLDFAAGAYAFQAFAAGDDALAIGWLAAWIDWDRQNDFPTSMTLPRRLLLDPRSGALLTPPVEATQALRVRELDGVRLMRSERLALAHGRVELEIDLTREGAALRLDIGHPVNPVAIVISPDGLEIRENGTAGGSRALAPSARPRKLRIFLDTGSVEVFADDGRWCGTRRIEGTADFSTLALAAEQDAIENIAIWELRLPGLIPDELSLVTEVLL